VRLAISVLLLHTALFASPLQAQHKDIVGTARGAGQFATLLAAVDAAGLTSTLQGRGPFTVFAPTDEAFRALPAGTVESLLKPENREQLKAILLYHVVSGKVSAADARSLSSARSVGGPTIRIQSEGSRLRINGATVVMADVPASNGVIHVIDQVLLPPETSANRASEGRAGDASARGLIDLAIERGVPLFNDGKPEATSAIYEIAARSVLLLSPSLASSSRRSLEQALRATGDDDRSRAWTLRRALDDAARALDDQMPMTTAGRRGHR
jgi:uncharacterized surface protein with fasciclin (FAS1) repeats